MESQPEERNNLFNSNNTFLIANEKYYTNFFPNDNNQNNSGLKRNIIQSINYNNINRKGININNINIIDNSNSINNINNMNNNTDKIKEILNSSKSLTLSKKSINSTNSQKSKNLKSKKHKQKEIDFSKKANQDMIKSILENLINCEKEYNKILNSTSKILHKNYSPCYIIQKTLINNIKLLFNYDYFKNNHIFNPDIILNQRNNHPIINISQVERITIDDFKKNNIAFMNEVSFLFLYNIQPDLEYDYTKYKKYEIYLKNNRGIIVINERNMNYFFVFEINGGDISEIINYDLINFKDKINEYKEIITKLEKDEITDEIWNKIINFSNNCNLIIDKKGDISSNINKLINKINNFKNYLENNSDIHSEEFNEKLEQYKNGLNLYEQLLNQKEKLIKQKKSAIKNKNNMNNYNNINNFNYGANNINNWNNISNILNSRSTYNFNNFTNNENNMAFSTVIINNKNNNFNDNFNNIFNSSYNNNINNININNNNNNGKMTINRFNPSLGLANIGSTCYMNATIQCLAHISELSEELIQTYNNNKKNQNYFLNYIRNCQLTKEYTLLLINIFFPRNNQRSYPPHELKKIIGSRESLFMGNEAEDAKDLLIFLIETMNTELNGGISAIYNDIVRLGIDQRDQLKIKMTFLNDFNSKNFSPFSKIFYGFSETCTLCHGCSIKKYNYECFNLVIFPLLEIKSYIIKNNNNYNNNNYNQYFLSLNDCFNWYQKVDFFSGDNKMYCNDCKSLQDSYVRRTIDQAPKVLIIILDRGLNNQDFTEGFYFDEYLSLNGFVPDNTISQYYLCGVIVHLGESGPGGHFVAYCKMDCNSPWYLYNDSSVSKCNNINEIFNIGIPYILFYHYFN